MCCVITEGVRFHCIFLETSKYATGSTFRCAAMLLNFYASKINIYVWCMYGIDYCARFEGEIVVDIQSLLLEKVSQLKHNNRYLLIVADAQKSQKLATPPHTAQHSATQLLQNTRFYLHVWWKNIYSWGQWKWHCTWFCGNYSVFKMHQFYFNKFYVM